MNEPNQKNTKLRNALMRALATLVVAILLLVATNFSVIDLIRGPSETDNILDKEQGDFVKSDVFAILGFYDSALEDGELQPGNYALVPMGGKLVTVHFTDRYRDSADTIMNDTYKLFNGILNQLDNYVIVEGTVSKLTEEESGMMYEWHNANKDSMVQLGIIPESEDASTYLDDAVLNVDTVNGKNQAFVIVLTVLAALCLAYFIVILILMGTGHYLDKPKKVEELEENDNKDTTSENSDDEDVSSDDTETEKEETGITVEPEQIDDTEIAEVPEDKEETPENTEENK